MRSRIDSPRIAAEPIGKGLQDLATRFDRIDNLMPNLACFEEARRRIGGTDIARCVRPIGETHFRIGASGEDVATGS